MMSDLNNEKNQSTLLESSFDSNNNTLNIDNQSELKNTLSSLNSANDYQENYTKTIMEEDNARDNDDEMSKEEADEDDAFDPIDGEVHKVKMVVTIVAAFPAETDKEMQNDPNSNKPRLTEGPKAQNFYKFEYQLMPDDQETLVTWDLVTYKIAAKLFSEKSDSKVLKSWEQDNKIWVTWNQVHELKLTKNRLLKLFEHDVVLKIWDSRDYCSAKSKFDKPKPFKFPKTGENTEEAVKSTVFDYCNKYLKQIPYELHNKLERSLPNQVRAFASAPQGLSEQMTNTLVAIPAQANKSVLSNTLNNKLGDLASEVDLMQNVKSTKLNELRNKNLSKLSLGSSNNNMETKATKHRTRAKEKSKKEIAAELDFLKKNGTTRVKLKMKILFGGYPYLVNRLEEPLNTIQDCLFTVSLENSLMSDNQLYELNPFTIKIENLTDMPNTPNTFENLRTNCEKAFCSYTFFKHPLYKTIELPQSQNIYFSDINVYLLGLQNKEELKEFFNSTMLEVEIHDRDRKPVKEQPIKACLFGNDTVDSQISSVNSVTSKHTFHNPFETRSKHWDPFGIAKLSLHEFVLGKKLNEYIVPVLPCTAPDVLGRNVQKNSTNTKTLGSEDIPLQTGNFLESNTLLKVRITVAKPLFELKSANVIMEPKKDDICVFARIIVKVEANKYDIIKTILDNFRKINSTALDFSSHPINVQDSVLSTYKLTEEEQASKSLDIITGFHLIDSKNHLFVMEGLKNRGIKEMIEAIPRSRNETGIEVMSNSEITFSKRLYASLDAELLKIKLFEPLDEIVKKPLLYVRDMTPKASYESLIKLYQLVSENSLKNVISSDLLPEASMILSMSKEFGVPLTTMDLEQLKSSVKLKENSFDKSNFNDMVNEETNYEQIDHKIPHTSRLWTPIDHYNEQFILLKKDKENQTKDFINENVRTIQELIEKTKHKKKEKNYITVNGQFNYSSQTLNSTDLALNKFRDYINQNDPKTLYSYNPEYHHSMTFVPVNLKQIEIEKKKETIDKWTTKEGWIFPGIKTNLQSNEHPKKPHQANLDELKEPWNEDFHLHTYKMKSPLDRAFYSHARNDDFDVWSKPKLDKSLPISIFESPYIRELAEKEMALSHREKWKSKLVVENPNIKAHRLLPATEMKEVGLTSSNQLDKLNGILKGEPKKKILMANGVNFNNIPALSVVNSTRNNATKKVTFRAGDSLQLRLTDDKNIVPTYNYERVKFEKLKGHDFDLSRPPRSFIYKQINDNQRITENNENIFNESKIPYILPNQNDLDYVKSLKI